MGNILKHKKILNSEVTVNMGEKNKNKEEKTRKLNIRLTTGDSSINRLKKKKKKKKKKKPPTIKWLLMSNAKTITFNRELQDLFSSVSSTFFFFFF